MINKLVDILCDRYGSSSWYDQSCRRYTIILPNITLFIDDEYVTILRSMSHIPEKYSIADPDLFSKVDKYVRL